MPPLDIGGSWAPDTTLDFRPLRLFHSTAVKHAEMDEPLAAFNMAPPCLSQAPPELASPVHSEMEPDGNIQCVTKSQTGKYCTYHDWFRKYELGVIRPTSGLRGSSYETRWHRRHPLSCEAAPRIGTVTASTLGYQQRNLRAYGQRALSTLVGPSRTGRDVVTKRNTGSYVID